MKQEQINVFQIPFEDSTLKKMLLDYTGYSRSHENTVYTVEVDRLNNKPIMVWLRERGFKNGDFAYFQTNK